MSSRCWLGTAFVFAMCSIAGPAFAQTFVFHLRGDQVVPPVSTTARGGCMGELGQGAAELALTCVHDVAGATVIDIHRAPAGANGDVAFDLGNPASPVQATWSGMTPANVADLLAGNLYIDVHTSGGAEIRGQILPRTVDLVAFSADGSQQVPPNASTATANCLADLDAAATSLAVQCTHNVSQPTAAHIHEAPARQTGPIVFTFASAASPIFGNVPVTPLLVADFAATFLYLEIHSAVADNDIRGQIGDVPPIVVPTLGHWAVALLLLLSLLVVGGRAHRRPDLWERGRIR